MQIVSSFQLCHFVKNCQWWNIGVCSVFNSEKCLVLIVLSAIRLFEIWRIIVITFKLITCPNSDYTPETKRLNLENVRIFNYENWIRYLNLGTLLLQISTTGTSLFVIARASLTVFRQLNHSKVANRPGRSIWNASGLERIRQKEKISGDWRALAHTK